MKRNSTFFIAVLAASACAHGAGLPMDPADPPEHGEKIHYQLILPEEKAPEVVKPSEPNPFSKADNKTLKEDGASGEENRVREILSNLPVTGYAQGGEDGPRVMVGPFKLRRNDMVPKVMAEQSVQLRVNSISKSQIDLIWVEKKSKNSGLAPRVVTLPVRVTTPRIRYDLPKMAASEPKNSSMTYQIGSMSQVQSPSEPPTPPETRKAVAADGEKEALPSGGKTGEEHPANVIMNYLFKSMNKAVDKAQTPPPATQPK